MGSYLILKVYLTSHSRAATQEANNYISINEVNYNVSYVGWRKSKKPQASFEIECLYLFYQH